METSNIVQTVIAIVQAYASILAITGAFYIFVIERTRSEFGEIDEKVDAKISAVNTLLAELSEPILLRSDVKKKGQKYLLDWRNGIKYQKVKDRLIELEDFEELYDLLPEHQSIKRKAGIWAFKLFRPLLVICAVILIVSIMFLYLVSINIMDFIIITFYHTIIGASIAGVVIFVYNCWDLAKIYD